MLAELKERKKTITQKTAWRIEGTLREFPKFTPINLWFDYPIHYIDGTGILSDLDPDSYDASGQWKNNFKKRKSLQERKTNRANKLEIAYSGLELSGKSKITYADIYVALGSETSMKTIRRWVKESDSFETKICPPNETIIVRKK